MNAGGDGVANDNVGVAVAVDDDVEDDVDNSDNDVVGGGRENASSTLGIPPL